MKNYFALLFLSFICFISCSKYDNTALIINSSKTEKHDHLGYGIYITPIQGYKKADSYFGYQAPKYSSSLSVKEIFKSIEQKKSEFSKNKLRSTKRKQVALKDIIYNGNKIGFYIIVRNNGAQAISHKLIFEYNSGTYQIDAFYPKKQVNRYQDAINEAIASIYLGEEEIEKSFLELAAIGQENNMIYYTRDGLFPTSDPDSVYLTMEEMKFADNSNLDSTMEMFKTLEYKVNEISESKFKSPKSRSIQSEKMADAMVYSLSYATEEKYFVLKNIIPHDGSSGVQVFFRSDKVSELKQHLKEMNNFLFTLRIERFN